jgi:hypothetical protein
MIKRKNPAMIEQRVITLNGKTYTKRAWEDGGECFYRHDTRRGCLVKLSAHAHAGLIAALRGDVEKKVFNAAGEHTATRHGNDEEGFEKITLNFKL